MPMKEIAKMQTRSRAQTVGQRIALSLLTRSDRMEPISESVALGLSEPLVIAEINVRLRNGVIQIYSKKTGLCT